MYIREAYTFGIFVTFNVIEVRTAAIERLFKLLLHCEAVFKPMTLI